MPQQHLPRSRFRKVNLAPTDCFGTAGGGKWIDFNNGACGTGALTFTLNRGDVPGFGFFLGSVAIPGGRATFNVTTTFTGGVTGQSTASYQLGRGLGDGFFAVLLDPDQTTGIATVTVLFDGFGSTVRTVAVVT